MTGAERPTGVVAMLFSDIEGSTQLARLLGDQWPGVLRAHHAILRGAITAAGGFVSGVEGDSFFATFTNTSSAVDAASTAQRALRAQQWPTSAPEMRVRIGIHTGEVTVVEGGYAGIEIHRAARVGAAAHGGQVLLTAAARRAAPDVPVEDLGFHRLKDFPQPERLFHFVVDPDRPAAWFPPPRSLDARPTNLPPNDGSLFGRDEDISAIESAFAAGQRVVTVTGPGGIGKTTVAFAVARRILPEHPGGAWFVPAEALHSADQLRLAIAVAVRVARVDALADRFEGVPVLWVLDNLEHLAGAGHVVARMLEDIPSLRVLATSRAPLRLAGERIFSLAPLEVADAAALLAHAAGGRGGEVDPADPAVAELVQRLDGLPLALELLATRLRVLSAAAVLSRLDSTLDLLSAETDRPERQRSLRATVAWSLELISESAREVFVRLAVFADAVPVEVIEDVSGSGIEDRLGAIAELVDHSLLRRDPNGLRLLAPLREIAGEYFVALPAAEDVRRRHARAMLAIAQRAHHPDDRDVGRAAANAVGADIWAASMWARPHDPELHTALVKAAGVLWQFDGRSVAGLAEVAVAIERAVPGSETWAELLIVRSMLRQTVGELDGAVADVDEALACLTDRSPFNRAQDLGAAVFAYQTAGLYERAVAAAEQAADAARASNSLGMLASALANLAQSYLALNRYGEAGTTLDEAEAFVTHSAPHLREILAGYRGDWYRAIGQPAEALEGFAAAFGSAISAPFEPWWLAGIALALGELGDLQAALELGAAALESAKERGIHVGGLTQFGERLDDAIARWRTALGPRSAEVMRAGRALTPDARRDRASEVAYGAGRTPSAPSRTL
ncbi:MAG: adenylate/guanylate cyclase domain-containing protein [Frankia sp.]|nr:adenylate/guanylate cyclase domain-containing protein [Frankia sp.]